MRTVTAPSSRAAQRLAGRADGEVVEAVVVEVAAGQRVAEVVVAPRCVPLPKMASCVQNSCGRRSKAAVEAVDDVDLADPGGRAEVLLGDADGEVVDAVAVEVAGGEDVAEVVATPRRARR